MKIRNVIHYAAYPLVLGIGGIGLANNAQADVAAVSINEISNLFVDISAPATVNSAVFRLDALASLDSVGTDSNSQNFSSGSAPFNIPQAFVGTPAPPPENTFTQVGNLGANYSRADAQILTSQLDPGLDPSPTGDTTRTLNIVENWLNNDDVGRADAGVSSITTFQFFADSDFTVSFTFNADIFLQALVDAGSAFPSDASAEISTVFAISNAAGEEVFRWTPDGQVAGGLGFDAANEIDPFSLNSAVTRDQSNTGTQTISNSGFFSVTSNMLAAGVHTLELRSRVTTDVQLTTVPVPEPATLALLGVGLLGLGFSNRRRKPVAC